MALILLRRPSTSTNAIAIMNNAPIVPYMIWFDPSDSESVVKIVEIVEDSILVIFTLVVKIGVKLATLVIGATLGDRFGTNVESIDGASVDRKLETDEGLVVGVRLG